MACPARATTHSRIIGMARLRPVASLAASMPVSQFWTAGLAANVRHVSVRSYLGWMRPLPSRSMGRSLFSTAAQVPYNANMARSGSPDSRRVSAAMET
jgi:hypothetical protein